MNEKINLTEIKKLAKSSLFGDVFRGPSRLFSMGGLGLGSVGVLGILGVVSITLAAVSQLIILGGAAVLFALVGGGFIAYRIKKDCKKIKKLDEDLDNKLKILRENIDRTNGNYSCWKKKERRG